VTLTNARLAAAGGPISTFARIAIMEYSLSWLARWL
jgi:hypothetical protein